MRERTSAQQGFREDTGGRTSPDNGVGNDAFVVVRRTVYVAFISWSPLRRNNWGHEPREWSAPGERTTENRAVPNNPRKSQPSRECSVLMRIDCNCTTKVRFQ